MAQNFYVDGIPLRARMNLRTPVSYPLFLLCVVFWDGVSIFSAEEYKQHYPWIYIDQAPF